MRQLCFSLVWVVMVGLLSVGCEGEDVPPTPPIDPAPPTMDAAGGDAAESAADPAVPDAQTDTTTAADPAPAAEADGDAEAEGDAEADAEAEALPVESLPVTDLAGLEALIAEAAERDQVLVIDFWATWCIPCVAMFPDLHGGLKEMGDSVRTVSVTLDDPGDYEQRAIRFLAEQAALDDAYIMVSTTEGQVAVVEGLGERWTDLVVPAILVYDRDGHLAGEFIDADARTDRILERVREVVSGEDGSGDTGGSTARVDERGELTAGR